MQYTAKITKKGQITIPAELRRSQEWTDGSHLIFEIGTDNTVKVHKEINLYDTAWGDYDFKKNVEENPELKMGNYDSGREGWQDNE